MSDIDIHAHHQMSHEDAQHAADELAADLAEQFAINYGWDEDVINFERPGVHGQILVRNSEIRVTARLGFLLMFLKPRIEQEVVRYLSEHFDCTFSG
jgi:putative polyhydroxyalkanoate system protein